MSLSTPSEQGFLLDLPLPALHATLHKAGPRSRHLCRALLAVYGPLFRLVPMGLDTRDELLSALATHDGRHSQLLELDLRHISSAALTDSTLLALCKALPCLRALRLPDWGPRHPCPLTAAAIAAAASQLPSLTSLHVGSLSDMVYPLVRSPLPPVQSPLPEASDHSLRELGLPASLLPASAAPLAHFTSLSKLCFHGGGPLDVALVASVAVELPALEALELHGGFTSAHQLRRLTRLTALKLRGCAPGGEVGTTCELLQDIGTLASLQSLHLQLCWKEYDAVPRGWLSGLSRLTSLRADFNTYDGSMWHGNLKFCDGVAACVPRMPALRELRIADETSSGAQLSAAAGACVASARSSLVLLQLAGLSLPASMVTDVLPQLTRLTCLRLLFGEFPHDRTVTTLGWLTALTGLRELWYEGDSGGSLLPCQLLARLPGVNALSLGLCPAVGGPYLEQLCVAMPQLTSLDLSNNTQMGGGLSALQHFTNLEVLGLGSVECSPRVVSRLKAPASFRRCHMTGYWEPEKLANVRAVLGGRVDVTCSNWKRDRRLG